MVTLASLVATRLGIDHVALQPGETLVAALVDRGLVDEEVLAELVAKETSATVVDLDAAEVDPKALAFVDSARAHALLVIPWSLDETSLHVVFADPLNPAARAAVQQNTDRQVRPLVAPLSSLRRALERVYGAAEATSVLPRTELRAEITRRVQGRMVEGTERLDRREHGSLAQRHEALVTVLVDAGIIHREDYNDVLQRLVDTDS
ncbi:MAG: hypothetical protein AAGE52_19050 [Myxococcota bacterium]